MFPKLITIGSFSLPTYGVLVALAFLFGFAMTLRLARRAELNEEAISNLAIYCVIAGLLGAKLLMILMDPEYRANPLEIFSLATLQSAGIFYGGFVAALGTAFFYIRGRQLPPLRTLDVFAPGIALGHGIGRLGCLAAGCCWGIPTPRPWAIVFRNPDAQTGVPLHIPLQPTQIYESLAGFATCALLYFMIQRKHADGQIIGLYLVLGGLARLLVEFVRYHDKSNPLGGSLSMEQWISIVLMALGGWILWRVRVAKPVLAEVTPRH